MDFPLHRKPTRAFPWRTATIVVAGVATVELVLLVVVGGALFAKSTGTPDRPAARQAKAAPVAAKARKTTMAAAATKPPAKAKAKAPVAKPPAVPAQL
ncbi:MAG: hypothetical protein FJW96_12780, partial [Actinobacteria bacterium]|nr:hypothetical protein [Actinomycetota bacterium]